MFPILSLQDLVVQLVVLLRLRKIAQALLEATQMSKILQAQGKF